MIKSKRYTLIVVIIVAMLLVVGNLATSVRANNINLLSPTPTGTPIVQPKHPGETVPPEQQEEIKSIIQAYFEIRYSARSISQPDGFRLGDFGNLMSDGPDAKDFLGAELGKLALERKYAELNRSRYVDYKYFLDFRSFTLDPATQLVTVSVVEDNEIIYEISAQGNPANPHVAHMSGLKHTIVLRKEGYQWRIVSDSYNDFLWRTLRQTGKSVEEMLERLSTMEAPQVSGPSSESAGAEAASLLPADPSSHAYDRNGAVDYAVNHAAATNYNPDYANYDDGSHGDCTNFVSQAIYEGGSVSMDIEASVPFPDVGGYYWYYLNEYQRAAAWTFVDNFYSFVTQYAVWTEGPEGYELGPVPEGQWPAGLMVGDVIQYNEEMDAVWEHAVIVVGFDPNNGNPIVASHSPNIPDADFMTVVPHQQMRFIHIERSDGNPSVKDEITLGSDDAGTNPTPCTFSATDNEVYLGACFGGGNITSGFLFNNIQIPKKAQMKYAYITFAVDGLYTIPVAVQIYGEDTGNSATFTTANPPENRSTPYSPAVWNITDQWDLYTRRATPQLSSVIQNIINRGDWASGNSLSVIVKNAGSNVRRVIAFERANADPDLGATKLIAAYDLTTAPSSLTYNSGGSQDGWILESTENSGVGGSNNSSATSFRLGDDNANKQYRSILHFNTASLPDNAMITSATLKIKQQGSITGTNPFTTHGSLMADIQKPYFGTGAGLANGDFQATPGQTGIATFDSTPVSNWYSAIADGSAFGWINLTGTTQFRLAFTLDDNNDLGADYIAFSSGNNGTAANRPQLIVEYYVP